MKHTVQLLWILVFFAAFLTPPDLGWAQGNPADALREELIPVEGQETAYGIPLSIANAQFFSDWYYEIELTPEERAIVEEALSAIPAPCCDDNPVIKCCCQRNNRICNLTRSAQGLAHWLVRVKGFGAEEVRASVEEWLRFLKPDYYLSKALEERGEDPMAYGMRSHEFYESCYRELCEAPLDAGGCGGMGLEVRLEGRPQPPCCLPGEVEG